MLLEDQHARKFDVVTARPAGGRRRVLVGRPGPGGWNRPEGSTPGLRPGVDDPRPLHPGGTSLAALAGLTPGPTPDARSDGTPDHLSPGALGTSPVPPRRLWRFTCPIGGAPAKTSPITIASVDDCGAVLLGGNSHVGETVPCPYSDYEHYIFSALHTVAVHNISVIEVTG